MLKRLLFLSYILVQFFSVFAQEKVFTFPLKDEINASTWRTTKKAFEQATAKKATYILIDLDTYGGAVDYADSIRTKILRSSIPVMILINNNAISAGAFISISCDSIYMYSGSSIGAATVVDGQGKVLPDKYQAMMRSKMRATAEETNRDPLVAEGMVDPDVDVPTYGETGKVVSLTTQEAIEIGYAQGEANSIQEVLELAKLESTELIEYETTTLDQIIGFLLSPAVNSLLLLLIFGGIYFELQSPGIGFPILAALTGAILFFAPYYLEGIAENWEIALFIVGLILVAFEVFVIPGFGIAGISGGLLIALGLILAMLQNDGFDFTFIPNKRLIVATSIVMGNLLVSIIGGLVFLPSILRRAPISGIIQKAAETAEAGFNPKSTMLSQFIGQEATAHTDLRPSGKIILEGKVFDAFSENNFIEVGRTVQIIGVSNAQLIVNEM